MAHRAEWLMQVEVARLFATWLPSDDALWTATDATTTSPTTGLMRRMRGCNAGLPDNRRRVEIAARAMHSVAARGARSAVDAQARIGSAVQRLFSPCRST